jgi:MEMO1 family protein
MMDDVRRPAVAGVFYPDDKINLKRTINGFLSNVPADNGVFFKKNSVDHLYGLIVPHAGYVYSGQVAAYGFSLLKNRTFDTVVIIGPSHYNNFDGFALPGYQSFRTPLGDIEVDGELAARVAEVGKGVFDYMNTAHIKEHSLEVQMPFLQTVLEEKFKVLPILMGTQSMENITKGADVLEKALGDQDKHYLVVISSDLSHYHSDAEAVDMDGRFVKIVEKMKAEELMQSSEMGMVEACGAGPIGVLLKLAENTKHKHLRTLIYRNSGNVSGDKDRVVGYMASAVW